MKNWVIKQPDSKAVNSLMLKSDLKKLAAEVLVAKGLDTIAQAGEFINTKELSSPMLLKDMQEAVNTINDAIDNYKLICIYGDYDCDGITSTVMLYSYLDLLGANVSYYIPERDEGYGLNKNAVKTLYENGTELIITVDNGISATEEAKYIYELGMKLVITDHHQAPDILPQAEAIVDPHRKDCPSPFKNLCGAGVVLKLLAALNENNYDAISEQFLDIAAIGTIADIVSLTGENRTIVENGLHLLMNTENIGLKALIDECSLSDKQITSSSVAFIIAPKINAAGRFASPKIAAKLLLTEDEDEALSLAKQLTELNSERKNTENGILQEIENQINENPCLLYHKVLVFYGEGWHHGVIGIVSARIVQKYNKPNFIITVQGDEARGSARSFGNYSIYSAIDACKDVFLKYGGHSGAGGFSLKSRDIPKFIEKLNTYTENNFQNMPRYTIIAEKALLPDDLTVENINSLSILEPFGEDNPAPVFALINARIDEIIPLKNGTHTKLKLLWSGKIIYTLIFGTKTPDFPLDVGNIADFIVSTEINTFNGNSSVALKIVDFRLSGIKQDQYFAAKNAYENYILIDSIDKNLLSRVIPSRQDLIYVYKSLTKKPILIDILFQKLSLQGINFFKLNICLDIFEELQLIIKNNANETVWLKDNIKKVNLEDSAIQRKLRCMS